MALVAFALCLIASVDSLHHMKHVIESRQDSSQLQILISNQCPDMIWPGITQQNGNGSSSGFELRSGDDYTVQVASDWQGRIWGRTNCTFPRGDDMNGDCLTGECGAKSCRQAGNPPATLAEFTMHGSDSQVFYDISLVDGYNLPMAIVYKLDTVPASTSNPSCVASVNDLAPATFNPYANNQQFLGSTSSSPLPFDTKTTPQSVQNWCPWDLQVQPPTNPRGSGVYPYPDGNIARPAYNPCASACGKYHKDKYCCIGRYSGRGNCGANYYSKAAKAVCPDAYSYPHDDQSSTFIKPRGGNFEVVFCPGGRSTNILTASPGRQGSNA